MGYSARGMNSLYVWDTVNADLLPGRQSLVGHEVALGGLVGNWMPYRVVMDEVESGRDRQAASGVGRIASTVWKNSKSSLIVSKRLVES